ncbi:unnamed protein product [Brachionus calyciflorus]|uniref:Delta(3,5)-Delta(2,4)-dienoyl-CoA isomerase, mitochondrial n=1 Tax=Brachionus calyciflorus TaxID=104777 RepID=A0A813T7Z2_9BILA|nr:unnamed protein product [Brachionus calyciflorus]
MSLTKNLRLVMNKSNGLRQLSTSIDTNYNFKTLKVTAPSEYVFHVEFNRPERRNAMNPTFFAELRKCFEQLKYDQDCRAVLVSGKGKGFTAGLDLTELSQMASMDIEDVGRKGFQFQRVIEDYQTSLTSIEKCHKPVIALIHGHCIGGGIDLITACDIRYCSKNAWFSVREVDVGLAADIGTLQRFPKITGNDSLVRELVYTARNFTPDEALKLGLISHISEDESALINKGLETAKIIASKSPIAVQGSKINLVFARDNKVEDSLKFVSAWNGGMLQSEDLIKSAMASMSKEEATFSKL